MTPRSHEQAVRELGMFLLIAVIALVGVGALMMASPGLPLRVGRLPGDIAYSGRHGTVYFPIVTCILVSLALTLVMWIVKVLRR